jgi:hypothetical protein
MLVLTLVGLALCFLTKSPGVLGFGLLLSIVGGIGLVLSLAAARIAANARPESAMASVEDISALRKGRPLPQKVVPKVQSISDNDAGPAG